MTADDFRDAALSLHDATERAHMGHPDFRANGRIFASLSADETSGTVKLSAEEQRELLHAHPKTFTPAAGAWGRQGWTVIQLRAADEASVRGALLLAWQNVTTTPRKAKQTAKKTAAKKRR